MMGRMARYLVSNPCEDACATIETSRRVEGAPVYRCPGCDSEWIELHERTPPAPVAPAPAPDRALLADSVSEPDRDPDAEPVAELDRHPLDGDALNPGADGHL